MTGRNFNPQQLLEDSTYDLAANPHSAITNQQFSGGGEGIRTPDPRVANAVLCQLSYTPDKRDIRGQISEITIQMPQSRVSDI